MSKLKTVWDAVNELRGDLNNTYMPYADDVYLFYCNDGSDYICDYSIDEGDDKKLVCTITEFNELVEEMTLGLDVNPVNHGHYLNYVYADKTLLEKETKPDYTSLEFWKDAPEGAQYYKADCEKFFASWYKDITDHSYKTWVVGKSHSWTHCNYKSTCLIENMVKRPQSTPTETPEEKEALDSIVNKPLVYTQEMVDNGELPPYGLLVQLRRDYGEDDQFYNGRLISEDRGVIWFDDDKYGGCLHSLNEVTLQPIDQRTKKEKAIDEFMAKNLKGGIAFKHLISKAYDEWVGE